MIECKVIKTGTTSDDRNWSLIQREESGFLMSAIVNPTEPHEVGQEVKLPKAVADAVKWQA